MTVHKIKQFYTINGVPVAITESNEILAWFRLDKGFQDKDGCLNEVPYQNQEKFVEEIFSEAQKLIE